MNRREAVSGYQWRWMQGGPTGMLRSMTELFALRRFRKRPATAEEIEGSRPFYAKGDQARGNIGVLLIHGFTVTPASFRGYAESLAADGYTVSVPLLPGHGGRPEDLHEIDWEHWLDAVVVAYDQLAEDCSDLFVAGISLGGSLALQLATRRSDIRQLFLLAPAIYPKLLFKMATSAMIPSLRRLGFRYWMHVAGDVKRDDGFELGYARTSLHGLLMLRACMRATEGILADVTTDVLLFQGRTDHEVPANKAREIFRRLGSRRKKLIWLENSYHEIPREHDSTQVLQVIRQAIAGFD